MNVLRSLDRDERDVDSVDHSLEVKPVRLMKFCTISGTAAERYPDENWYLIRVVDFRERIDARQKAGSSHESHRGDTAQVGPRAKADCRLLTIDRDVSEAAVVAVSCDEVGDLTVRETCNR